MPFSIGFIRHPPVVGLVFLLWLACSQAGVVALGATPAAPENLMITRQAANSISMSWTAPPAGADPIASYRIYRNGTYYATSRSTSYTDNKATTAVVAELNAPANLYAYAVSAVDSQGNEGPQTNQATFNVYVNGVFSWPGDYSYGASIDYRDKSGMPQSGRYDIAVTVTSDGGGFQPYTGNVVPTYDLEAGAFGYISMDLKPTEEGQKWRLSMMSRLPPGDVYPWSAVDLGDYGPAPVPGKWATYKVPLSALSIGVTRFVGSISGTKLTVTHVESGVGIDAGGFIAGAGVAPGTYISGYDAQGGPGTYTVYPSQNVASTSMLEQRTSVYKFDIIDRGRQSKSDRGGTNNKYYVDNIKFTVN
jgi:hypothetical protein